MRAGATVPTVTPEKRIPPRASGRSEAAWTVGHWASSGEKGVRSTSTSQLPELSRMTASTP